MLLYFVSTFFVFLSSSCTCEEPDSFKFVELQHLRSIEINETTWACACGGHQWSSLSLRVQSGTVEISGRPYIFETKFMTFLLLKRKNGGTISINPIVKDMKSNL